MFLEYKRDSSQSPIPSSDQTSINTTPLNKSNSYQQPRPTPYYSPVQFATINPYPPPPYLPVALPIRSLTPPSIDKRSDFCAAWYLPDSRGCGDVFADIHSSFVACCSGPLANPGRN
ncbi:hypothetical protein Pst134EB_016810 [Puccinia striiformis f. sp. tritici]|nr:hypothetical protein Pst134EB_016810 [Puccinia striiformis f. sp. tritici]